MSRTYVLVILVFAQFACVSLWFAANAVMADLVTSYHIQTSVGWITSMVQLGFIFGTLVYAVLSLSDRFSPSLVFFASALFGAMANSGLLFMHDHAMIIYGLRFLTGFFIAGIYPTGMKIAVDYFDKDISKALGYLLGALVIGTAFPLLLRSGIFHLAWKPAIIITSLLAVAGGSIIGFGIPDGPFRKSNPGFQPGVITSVFKNRLLKKAAFGYFGHMWELYAFWAFVPSAVLYYSKHLLSDDSQHHVMQLSFFIIAMGSIACVLGGYWAMKIGSAKVALVALVSSGLCCLVSPIMLQQNNLIALMFLIFWGMTVIMDSPQFSSLVSRYAPAENRGTVLTIVNCIGFSITIFSIQLLDFLNAMLETRWIFLFLFPGPFLGCLALYGLKRDHPGDAN